MQRKAVICPRRLRQIPPHFSWVDHRLVRDEHICGRSAEALALYLFVVTVGNAQGLSWYSDTSVCRWLGFNHEQLLAARQELKQVGLIAYRKPVYQVLELTAVPVTVPSDTQRGGSMVSMGEILRKMSGGTL